MERDPAVDAYIGCRDGQGRNTLAACREQCLGRPDTFVECVRYGMPCYSREGEPELALAAQECHVALYMMRVHVIAAHRDRPEGYSVGKGCIRFPEQAPSDLELVGDLVKSVGAGRGPVC
jgi:uncharacterized protein YdhG (YjbR/CyaY superfamily)